MANDKVQPRLPPILHAYLEDLADLGVYGRDKADVARSLIEDGIKRALSDKLIEVNPMINPFNWTMAPGSGCWLPQPIWGWSSKLPAEGWVYPGHNTRRIICHNFACHHQQTNLAMSKCVQLIIIVSGITGLVIAHRQGLLYVFTGRTLDLNQTRRVFISFDLNCGW